MTAFAPIRPKAFSHACVAWCAVNTTTFRRNILTNTPRTPLGLKIINREDNGALVHRALGLALNHKVSRNWKGYWQRSADIVS